MSTIIMSQCWPLGGMSSAQKAVLISLADQANDDGVCWPSVGTIAKRTCLSERAVQEALQWLQATGAIFREYKTNSSTVYTVTPARFDPAKAPVARSRSKGADGAPPAPSAPPAPGAPGGADGAPLGVNQAHPTPAPGAPKSSLNRKGNHQGTAKAQALGLDGVSDELLADWQAVRSAKRAGPLTATAVKGLQREARKAGLTDSEAIEICCTNGWQGFRAAWYQQDMRPAVSRATANTHKHAAAYATILEA
ncbi:helix-turn-helix domain-containing protein [Comamonas kerstersii]|uniref:helix-turn-helix domain-containing protein n=1 Tax=Comamonas kerstersii TaxID=225992 RepID=UPI001B31CC4A|nr:helix-turn-helix domain-containing protein [Comamonas kerstersii]QTW20223.1 helix-turn-helix domain-containing protein [Comamonas kerstersii]